MKIMEYNLKKQEGFTLLETLVVLLVSSILLLVPTLSMGGLIEDLEISLFFREVTSNLTLIQNQAIMGGTGTQVNFYGREQEDLIRFQVSMNHPLNREMTINSPYYRLRGLGTYNFRFKETTGNITSSNSIGIWTSQGDYELTYLLGSGRFDITKGSKK